MCIGLLPFIRLVWQIACLLDGFVNLFVCLRVWSFYLVWFLRLWLIFVCSLFAKGYFDLDLFEVVWYFGMRLGLFYFCWVLIFCCFVYGCGYFLGFGFLLCLCLLVLLDCWCGFAVNYWFWYLICLLVCLVEFCWLFNFVVFVCIWCYCLRLLLIWCFL